MQPTHRTSRGRTRRRRSHLALKPHNTCPCPNCGSTKLPHRACAVCGYVRPGLRLKVTSED